MKAMNPKQHRAERPIRREAIGNRLDIPYDGVNIQCSHDHMSAGCLSALYPFPIRNGNEDQGLGTKRSLSLLCGPPAKLSEAKPTSWGSTAETLLSDHEIGVPRMKPCQRVAELSTAFHAVA
jgi:hypothetical protein